MDECPSGYVSIGDEETCIKASNALHSPYVAENSNYVDGAVCNGRACGDSSGYPNSCENTRLSTNHGNKARWICETGAVL